MSIYKLDLESLLPLLESFRQDGCLSVVLPPGSLKQKGPSKVRINLLEGQVVYCHIEDSFGGIYVLDNSKIAHTLYGLGELNWHLDEGADKLYTPPGRQPQTQPLPHQAQQSPYQNQSSPYRTQPLPYQSQPLPYQNQQSPYQNQQSPYRTQPLSHQENVSRQYSPIPPYPPTQYSPANQSAQRPSVSSLVPRVIATPDASILNSLSRNQRRVLVLIDGTRNIKKITEILFPSSQDMRAVLQVLRELERMGLVIIVG